MHGGASLAGTEAPAFRHGRYSKHLPTRLLDRYEEARDDAELTELKDDIALIDARLTDLLARVDTGESGAVWAELQRQFQRYDSASADDRADDATLVLTEIRETILSGARDEAAWREVMGLLTQRRKTTESERKRLVELSQSVPASQVVVFMTALQDIIRRNVKDPAVRAAIGRDMLALADQRQGRPA